MCYPIVEVTKTNLNINHSRISFISFTFAALIYGIPYNLPFYYWAILGIALAFVELSKKEKKSLQLSKVENQLALS